MSASGTAFEALFSNEAFVARCCVLMGRASLNVLLTGGGVTDLTRDLAARITSNPRAAFAVIGRQAITASALESNYETPDSMTDAAIVTAFEGVLPQFAQARLTF